MKLPNAERAIIDLAKLGEYCLSPEHPRGRHKARVFAAVLGLTAVDAERLRAALLEGARINDAMVAHQDDYGQRYVVDLVIETAAGRAVVRSSWIVRRDEDIPRLTSCYVVKKDATS